MHKANSDPIYTQNEAKQSIFDWVMGLTKSALDDRTYGTSGFACLGSLFGWIKHNIYGN